MPNTETENTASDLRALAGSKRDEAENAKLRLSGRVTVVARLCELLESNGEHQRVDFATQDEDMFWYGMRALVKEIGDDAYTLHRLATEG